MKMLWCMLVGLVGLVAPGSGRAQGFQLMHQLRTDLSHATTYSWKPGPPPAKETVATERFHEQIDKDMKAKGWKLLPTGGDIVLSGVVIVTSAEEDNFTNESRPNALVGGDLKTPNYAGEMPTSTTARFLTIAAYDSGGKKMLWEARTANRLTKEMKDTLVAVEKSADLLVGGFVVAGK